MRPRNLKYYWKLLRLQYQLQRPQQSLMTLHHMLDNCPPGVRTSTCVVAGRPGLRQAGPSPRCGGKLAGGNRARPSPGRPSVRAGPSGDGSRSSRRGSHVGTPSPGTRQRAPGQPHAAGPIDRRRQYHGRGRAATVGRCFGCPVRRGQAPFFACNPVP